MFEATGGLGRAGHAGNMRSACASLCPQTHTQIFLSPTQALFPPLPLPVWRRSSPFFSQGKPSTLLVKPLVVGYFSFLGLHFLVCLSQRFFFSRALKCCDRRMKRVKRHFPRKVASLFVLVLSQNLSSTSWLTKRPRSRPV